jgi:hypothetical protein
MLIPDVEIPEKFTWADLKAFCEKLTPEQLLQEVIVPQDESSITIKYASELGDDQYYFIDEEYTCTEEDYDADIFDGVDFLDAIDTFEHTVIPGRNVYLFDE